MKRKVNCVEVMSRAGRNGWRHAWIPSQPAIEKSGHAVNARHDDVEPGRRWRKCSSTGVRRADARETAIGSPAVGSNRRARGHGGLMTNDTRLLAETSRTQAMRIRPVPRPRISATIATDRASFAGRLGGQRLFPGPKRISCLFPGRGFGPRRRFRLPRHRPPGGLKTRSHHGLGEAYEATSRPSGSCRGRVSSVAQGH